MARDGNKWIQALKVSEPVRSATVVYDFQEENVAATYACGGITATRQFQRI